jgi:hypothetical protein
MLSLKKQFHYAAFISFFLLFSCQKEEVEELYSTNETVTKTSPLASYLQRLTMVATTEDNLIDKSSYCTVKLPYIVRLNDATIPIDTAADYQKVLDNINAYHWDDDIVKITFPVTMVYYDHTEKIITSQSNFDSLLSYWSTKHDILPKINCLNIIYPITIYTYNTANQIASTTQIKNDANLYRFIDNLNDNKVISLSYPISVTDYNSNLVTITSNSQFENAFKEAIDTCKDSTKPPLNFVNTLTQGSWRIYYFSIDSVISSQYDGYVFVFNTDQSVTATKSNITTRGVWETSTNNGLRIFRLRFNQKLLKQLDIDWDLYEFDNDEFAFFKDRSNTVDQLLFKKI